MKFRIALIKGDGIGPEIVGEAVMVLKQVAEKFGHDFAFDEKLVGGAAYDACGDCLPDATLAACRSADAVLLGAVGVPVFSGFRGGLGVLLDTTGGYIIGFVAAALVYWLLTARLGESLPVKTIACVLGLAVCYAFGTAWFLVLYARTTGPIGVTTALGWCVIPYIIPDLLKLALAIILSRRVKKFLK